MLSDDLLTPEPPWQRLQFIPSYKPFFVPCLCITDLLRLANTISDSSHVLNREYQPLPFNRLLESTHMHRVFVLSTFLNSNYHWKWISAQTDKKRRRRSFVTCIVSYQISFSFTLHCIVLFCIIYSISLYHESVFDIISHHTVWCHIIGCHIPYHMV